MLTSRIIPCLDIRDGRVVKGVRFQNLRDSGDPVERALAYAEAGADELVILDVSATPEGRGTAIETVEAVRAVLSIPLTVGGGVRTLSDATRLLRAGADKVGVNTAAVESPDLLSDIAGQLGRQCTVVESPDLLSDIAGQLGRQCTVVAIDAARRADQSGWEVVIRSGKERTGQDAVAWAQEAAARGAGEILLTSWDRDGTRLGYDVDLLAAVTSRVGVPVIASGGASAAGHLVDALEAGASAVLAASIFHEEEWTIASLKKYLSSAGIEVRPC